jgi:hypothetical protein
MPLSPISSRLRLAARSDAERRNLVAIRALIRVDAVEKVEECAGKREGVRGRIFRRFRPPDGVFKVPAASPRAVLALRWLPSPATPSPGRGRRGDGTGPSADPVFVWQTSATALRSGAVEADPQPERK